MSASSCLLSFFILFLLILSEKKVSGVGDNNGGRIIFAVLDESSRAGKEQRVAIQAAIEDVYQKTNQSFELSIKDTQGVPSRAALAAAELVNYTSGLKAILGPQTWEETSLVSEIGSEARIPVLSFSESIPRWASENWPFLIQASPNQDSQMDAIASIVDSYDWRQVAVIYEDSESFTSDVFPHLSDSLQGNGSDIVEFLALPPIPSASFSEELQRLKNGHCRVFVVHLSFSSAVWLFEAANKMDMMEKNYVWITTDLFTSFVHSVNASLMASMQGIVGVTPYFPEDQSREFRERFRQTYPAENNDETGVFSFQAYNIAYGVCLAMLESNDSQSLAKTLKFKHQALSTVSGFQIINIAENRSIPLGFWSKGKGFSKTIGETTSYNNSMKILDQPVWPGGSTVVPKGWSLPPLLRVGVPIQSSFKQLVNVSQASEKYFVGKGFTTTVFDETLRALPYSVPYEFIPFNGTNDELVKQVYLKKFDAAVGELAIVADRYRYVEFTHPYTESSLYMIVPLRPVTSNRAWLFLKPFTGALWAIIVVTTIYNGFVIWLIERNHCPELKGSIANQMGTLVASAFTTLFSLHGERQHSNLSRMSMVVWLFVALIITQTYTANLASILTADLLKPSVTDIEFLRTKNLEVGFYRDSFVKRFLVDVLHFREEFITSYNSPEEYAVALRNKCIQAVFMEAPFAKLFLAEHSQKFTKAGPTFRIGGFGFVLPQRSPFLHDLNKALLNISEVGTLDEIEAKMIGSKNSEEEEITSLSPSDFWLLFALTGSTSTIALIVYIFRCEWSLLESATGRKTMLKLIFVAMKKWGGRRMRMFGRMIDLRRDGNRSNGANRRDRV